METFFISIVVPALNAEKMIENCVKSLLDQQYLKEKYEIIIIDNGSTDNTLKLLEKFRKRILISKEPKKGSYCARNKGIKISKGDIIAFIDSDCVADRKWLSQISRAFDNKTKLVGGRIKALKPYNNLLRYYDIFGHPQELSFASDNPFFATANMAIRKKDVKKLAYFNESLKSGGDVEFCSRLIKDKKEIYYEPKAIVEHMYCNSLIKFMKRQYYYGKWHRKIRKQNRCNIPMPSYIKIFISYGINFLFLRILQDISYKLGFYLETTKRY